MNNNIKAFFSLVRAGLWNDGFQPELAEDVNYSDVFEIAQEQAVAGLVAAGLEKTITANVSKELILTFVGNTLQIEQRNEAMNEFVAKLIKRLRTDDIYVILVKGQGIAQCYEKPLWRTCGDVDLLVSDINYDKVKDVLATYTHDSGDEIKKRMHISFLFKDTWVVELHGSLCSGLLRRVDKVIGEVQNDIFYGGNVRSWQNGNTTVFLPDTDNNVFIVFSHIIEHFFGDGIGLRQICDWCRLLWTNREKIDIVLLEHRLRKAGLITEWKSFGYLAVNWLGMPVEAMPFYSSNSINEYRASRLLKDILKAGNFGQNRDFSYARKYPFVVRKAISFLRHTLDNARHFLIFPIDSVRVWINQVINGVLSVFIKR